MGKSDTVIHVGNRMAFPPVVIGWNTTVAFPPDSSVYTGLIRQYTQPDPPLPNNSCASEIHFNYHTESLSRNVEWVRGRKPDGLLNCRFTRAPFYYQDYAPGYQGWAQVIELNSLSSTSFTVTSLNGTFQETTATMTATSGYKAVGTVSMKNSTGVTEYDFQLRGGYGSPGQPSHCNEFDLIPKGSIGKSFGWRAGPSPIPDRRPCNIIFEGAKECHDAWLNKCSWCTSSDKFHQLCFPAEFVKNLTHDGWACVSSGAHVQVV